MARRLGQRPQRPQERKRHKQHVGYNVISSNGGLEVHINACGVWAVEVIFGAWEAISITMEYTGSLSHLNAAYYRCNISLMPASQGNLPSQLSFGWIQLINKYTSILTNASELNCMYSLRLVLMRRERKCHNPIQMKSQSQIQKEKKEGRQRVKK